MSAPIYTPFFIHPNQKKRITRKRNVTLQSEEGYGSSYDTRSKRHTSSNDEWSVEPAQIPALQQTHKKRSHDSLEETSRSQQQRIHKIDESDNGPNEVAAEVEVNVEDDVGDTEPSDAISKMYRSGVNTGAESPTVAHHLQQQQQFTNNASSTGLHHRQASQSQLSHHRSQHIGGPLSSPGSGGGVLSKQFDPETCADVTELRHRLYAAYDRIEQLGRANICINRLKHDNGVMKSELNKCTYRISQLESIVLERNLRLKQLLSENVLMSARMKRIQSEFGVDAVREIFNRDKE